MSHKTKQNYLANFQRGHVTPVFQRWRNAVAPLVSRAELEQIFRVPYIQIWEWQTGRRRVPRYALQICQDGLNRYREELDTIEMHLVPGPGKVGNKALAEWKAQQNL